MEIIQSNKGGNKLCYRGYMYVLHRECNFFYAGDCNASLTTTLNKEEPSITRDHNHPADEESIKVAKAIGGMKIRAKDTLSKPAQVFAEAVLQLENTTRARLPLEDSVKRTLRKQKSKNCSGNATGSSHRRYANCDWATTGGIAPERFLLNDNGPNAAQRVIIFSTDAALNLLATTEEWYLDGNFSLAPIRSNNLFTTAVFCLLQNKTQQTYEYLLRTVLQKCEERGLYCDPQVVHLDFERPAIQAVKNVLGEDISVRGCFYHLTQSTFRKIQELGLVNLYKENKAFNHFCGMIDGLAFLPPRDVRRGMLHLREVAPAEAEDLLNYFDATYVSGTFRRVGNNNDGALRMRNISPMFPVDLWNVHQATLQGQDRTNNQTEGWNNRFSNLVGENHPTVWKLISKMRQEVAADLTKIEQNNLGVIAKKKKNVYEDMQRRLNNLCMQYEGDVGRFLLAVGHTIRFRTNN
ncbi:hypothetical protein RN001_007740 [Aquatica leii]|uniref:MULE transposase domain-containing protein n=1 Tax=Aquatica leii TaxID=1421715 RepID=A0AAN7P967_9COLE|nr:hypothetical protein RN001_007740 [Aquatica leii]